MTCANDAELEELRSATPLALARWFDVGDVGRPFRCPSPDHEDRNPSAAYYRDSQRVHCFGCGRNWDVFDLAGIAFDTTAFPEQVRRVAELMGVELQGNSPSAMRARLARTRRPKADTSKAGRAGLELIDGRDASEACRQAFERLYTPAGAPARAFLHARGLSDEDIVRHGLGYSTHPQQIQQQFNVREPEGGGFVVIPFYDEACETVPYAMLRTVPAGSIRHKEWRPKGVRSPLWHEHLLTSPAPVICVAEGLIDAMAVEKITGVPTVGLGGASCAGRFGRVLAETPDALRPRKVLVFMDADDAGRDAARKIEAALDSLGIPCSAAPPYPAGAKDPDEWLMAMRGECWTHEAIEGSSCNPPLLRTRWIDGQ